MSKKPILLSKFIPSPSKEPRSLVAVCSGDFFKAKLHFNEHEPGLVTEREARSKSNIYMICKRPKVRIVPGSMTDMTMEGKPTLQVGLLHILSENGEKQVPFAFDPQDVLEAQLKQFYPGLFPARAISSIKFEVGDAPHTSLVALIDIYDQDTMQLVKPLKMELELDYLSSHFKWYVPEMQDLEVLYVGQSVGAKYESTSEQRLAGDHHARRDILSEASRKDNFDVIGIYFDFKAIIGERNTRVDIGVPMPVKNVINLVEGALINQMQTRFNEHCIEKYPHGPAMAKDVRDLGVDHIHVSIDSGHDPIRLFSKTSEVSFVQNVIYEYLPDGKSVNKTSQVSGIQSDHEVGNRQLQFAVDHSKAISDLEIQLKERLKPKSFLETVGDRLRSLIRPDTEPETDVPGMKM